MKRFPCLVRVLLCALLGFSSKRVIAAEGPRFHYSIHESTPSTNAIVFPFGLIGGQPRPAVTAILEGAGFHRGDYDKENTVWMMRGKISFKTFQPTALSLRYEKDKLMQVTLIHPNVSECHEIVMIIQDAVAYVKNTYAFPAENVQPEPHFNSNSCVFYMKPGQSGWQTWSSDYAVDIESSWRDGKEMVYSAYMTFTYIPLYNPADKKSN